LMPAHMPPFPIQRTSVKVLAYHLQIIKLGLRWNSRAVKEGLLQSRQTIARHFDRSSGELIPFLQQSSQTLNP
jgi:hypothetical protein